MAKVVGLCAVLGLLVAGGVWGYPLVMSRVLKTPVTLTEVSLLSSGRGGPEVELTATGYVVPQVVSKVGAKVSGRVLEVRVKQGQAVKAGTVLLRLDALESKAAVQAAKARLLSARARVQTARANLAEAQSQAVRARVLADKEVGPQASAADLEARAKSQGAMVSAAEAEALAAQADLDVQKTGLAQLTVVAPIDGTVLNKPPEIGEIVGPLGGPQIGGSTAGSVFELADLSQASLVVETDVPEGRLSRVQVGGATEIVLDAYPGRRLRGKTLDILPRVSRAKATVAVRVGFEDAEGMVGVLPEMAARIQFLSKPLTQAALQEKPKIHLPSSALVEREGKAGVFVFDRQSEEVRFSEVSVGDKLGSGFELLRGPGPGTAVVREPLPTLRSGQKVKVQADNPRSGP